MKNFIPHELYLKIQKILPVACVDLIIQTEQGVLLGVRDHEPAKGKIWLIGGRVLYGESLEEAVKRKALEETGLEVKIVRQVGAYTLIFKKGEKRYNVVVVYLVEKTKGKLRMNEEYSKHVFLKSPYRKLHPYVLTALNDSKVFKKKIKLKKRNHFSD